MNKQILRSLAFVSAIVGSSSVFANQEEASKLDVKAMARAKYSLLDSTRKSSFDFFDQRVDFGFNYTQGMFSAEFMAEFKGNTNGQGATSQTGSGNNAGVKTATINANFVKTETTELTAGIGRYTASSASYYGNDAITSTWSLSGFDPADGIFVNYAQKIGGGDIAAQLGVVNAMTAFVYGGWTKPAGTPSNVWFFDVFSGNNSTTVGSAFGSSSGTDTKGIQASISGHIPVGAGNIALSSGFGEQAKSPTVVADHGASINGEARDQMYFDFGVGYELAYTQFGVWTSYTKLGETKVSTQTKGGVEDYSSVLSPIEDTYYQYGIGGQVDSKQFGITNLLANDDSFTVAAGAQVFQRRQSGAGSLSSSEAEKNDVTMYSVGIGYKKAAFSFELNYSFFSAENKVFYNNDQNGLKDNAQSAYLLAKIEI